MKRNINKYKLTELPISDRHSTGSQITKHNITDAYLEAVLVRNNKEQINLISEEEVSVKEEVEEVKPKKERISLKEIDDRLMTIDDFLK